MLVALGLIIGLFVGYLFCLVFIKTTVDEADKQKEQPQPNKEHVTHTVEIVCKCDQDYTEISISIDNVKTGTVRTFTEYALRDKVTAFHLIKYGKALNRETKDLLEAIGTSRVDCEKSISGKNYLFKFVKTVNNW